MADKQQAPQVSDDDGTLHSATEAFLGLMTPSEEMSEAQESAPTEDVEESTGEIQDEPLEEESEEYEEESVEEEDEYESDESEEGEDEEEPGMNTTYAVKVDGEEIEVSLDELVKGYSRQSDYTRKTQELSQQRKEMEALQQQYQNEVMQIQSERQQYIDGLQNALESSLSVLDQFVGIDWEHLRQTDPIGFVTKKEEYRDAQEKVQRTQQQQQAARQRQEYQLATARQEAMKNERAKLIEALPEWSDPEKQASLASNLKSYASTQGFSEEEINSLIDHRSLLVLRKAMLYDKASSSDIAKKKIKGKPKVVKSGSGKGRKSIDSEKRSASMKRLKQSGRPEDAANLLEAFVET